MLEEKITLDKLVRWILCGLIILAVFYITNSMSEVLLPFFIACLLAYLLYPLVRLTEKYLHIRIRALSILFVLILLIGIITGIGLLIVPSMIEQFEKLSDVTMHYLSQTAQTNSLTNYIRQWIQEHQRDIDHFLRSQDFSDTIKTAMPQVFSFVGQTASVVISIIASFITLLYMFFILLDYEFLTDNWIKIFPKKNRPFWTAFARCCTRIEQLYTWTKFGIAHYGHFVLHRIYDY